MLLNIFAFALALVALGFAAAAWITLQLRTRAQESLRSWSVRTCNAHSARLEKLEKTAPNALAAEVAELSEAVAKLAATQRRFAGRFDAYVQHSRAEPVSNGSMPVDDELAALIELQNASKGSP